MLVHPSEHCWTRRLALFAGRSGRYGCSSPRPAASPAASPVGGCRVGVLGVLVGVGVACSLRFRLRGQQGLAEGGVLRAGGLEAALHPEEGAPACVQRTAYNAWLPT